MKHQQPAQQSLIQITDRGLNMTATAARILNDMEEEFRDAIGESRLHELRLVLQEMMDVVERRAEQPVENATSD
ncbi:MAG: hypothetical protein WBW04_12955 [Nitrolancea sp.]